LDSLKFIPGHADVCWLKNCSKVIYFYFLQNNMRTFTDVLIDIGAGSVGGAVGCVVGHPLDTVKVRMQRYAQSSMIQCTKLTYAGEGIMGFYKGILPPLVSISLYQVPLI
jgi:hypothetical protein